MKIGSAEYKEVLKKVHRWTPDQRITLIHDLLETLSPTQQASGPSPRILDRAIGLLAGDHPAPSDTEVDVWLEERRQEKYGWCGCSSTPTSS